jgi:hypothetical protein
MKPYNVYCSTHHLDWLLFVLPALTFNKLCILPTECIYGLCLAVGTNSDYFTKHLTNNLCNGDIISYLWCRTENMG